MSARTRGLLVMVAIFGIGWLGMNAGAYNLHPEGDGGFTPVAKVADLMGWNKATSNKIKSAMKGNDPDWDQIASDARVWAEIANVLKYHRPESEAKWHEMAEKYKGFALQVATAADNKDKDAAGAAFGSAFATCKACHDVYRN